MESCEGCGHMRREDAGKGFDFCICELGKFEHIPHPVVERVRHGGALSGPVPAWCKMGRGVRYGG